MPSSKKRNIRAKKKRETRTGEKTKLEANLESGGTLAHGILDEQVAQVVSNMSLLSPSDTKQRKRIIGGLAGSKLSVCDHGSGPLSAFILAFEGCLQVGSRQCVGSEMYVYLALANMLHQHGFNFAREDDTFKKDAIASLVSLGIDLVLKGQSQKFGQDRYFSLANVTAMAIALIEECGDLVSLNSKTAPRLVYLMIDPGPETLRFFAKRAPCSCLSEMYNKMKMSSQPKLGKCKNCMQLCERSNLKRCKGCNLAEYCSKECQTQDWSAHKPLCEALRKSKTKCQSILDTEYFTTLPSKDRLEEDAK